MKYPAIEGYLKTKTLIVLKDENGEKIDSIRLADFHSWLETTDELIWPCSGGYVKATVNQFWETGYPNDNRLNRLNEFYQSLLTRDDEREYEERERFESWLTSSVDTDNDLFERNY